MDKLAKLSLNSLIEHIQKTFITTNHQTDSFDQICQPKESLKITDSSFHILQSGKKIISDFPTDCKNIFSPFVPNIFRHSSDSNMGNSFYVSALNSIYPEFRELSLDKKEEFITVLKKKMSADLTEKKLYHVLKYKELKLTIKYLVEQLDKNNISKPLVRYFADFFNINIFIVNILEDKISAIFAEEYLDVFKPCIVLSYYENIFESLSFDDSFIWNGNACFDKIIETNISRLYTWDKTFPDVSVQNIDLDKYLVVYDDNNKYTHRTAELLYRANAGIKIELDNCEDYYTETVSSIS